jgi:gluconolactonase
MEDQLLVPPVHTRELVDVEVVAEHLDFPEGPVALSDGSVLVVEIAGGRLSRCWPGGRVDVVATLGGGPNGAAIGPDGAVYVCNNGGLGPQPEPGRVERVELATGRSETLYTGCDGSPLNGPNDLVFDPTGHFWFTDLRAGRIHYAAADGSSVVAPVTTAQRPNGVGLSPDGTILYWAETSRRQVHRRRVDTPGGLVPSPGCDVRAVLRDGGADRWSLLAGLPGACELDSMAIDSSGAVCVGALVDGGIVEIAADGSSVIHHHLPSGLEDDAVTNICFGGPDLRTAYLTASQTGRLLSCRWHRPGLPLAFSA